MEVVLENVYYVVGINLWIFYVFVCFKNSLVCISFRSNAYLMISGNRPSCCCFSKTSCYWCCSKTTCYWCCSKTTCYWCCSKTTSYEMLCKCEDVLKKLKLPVGAPVNMIVLAAKKLCINAKLQGEVLGFSKMFKRGDVLS